MARTKKTLSMGQDATISIMLRFIHPSVIIRQKYPNHNPTKRLDNTKVLRLEEKKVSRKQQKCVVFTSTDFVYHDGSLIELHAVIKNCKVIAEGPTDKFFNRQGVDEERTEDAEEGPPMPPDVLNADVRRTVTDEDVNNIRGVVTIEDDNDPLPENIPLPNEQTNSVLSDQWGHSGVCYRKMEGATDGKAKINFQNDKPTRLQLFELFFPMEFVKTVIIIETNKQLQGKPLTYGEFLVFIGLWLMMSTIQGFHRRDFWSKKEIDLYDGAPYRFGEIMTRNRFEDVLAALQYTNKKPPEYKDPFWEIRQLVDAWNSNMSTNFTASWISCLDESMMKWMNAFTCPGFMFVPRKPWPFGNEWHTIACGVSGILYQLELVEGKDEPTERPNPEYSLLGKTVGLLLRLTKPLWATGKVVVLDSGFCVLQGLIELKKRGVYAAALIKKRRYWPKYIDGARIKAHFDDKEIGDVDALKGTLDEVPFHVFGMKEEDYILMLMSTYGTCNRMGEEKFRTVGRDKRRISFQYPEVVHNHYQRRGAVDSHNARRMAPIAIEETWSTLRWPNRVFAYLLATSEVNANLGESEFGDSEAPRPQLEFRRLLAKDLITNKYVWEEDSPSGKRKSCRLAVQLGHDLVKLPPWKKFSGTKIVKAKSKYPFNFCNCKGSRVRTYCRCTPGTLLCALCFAIHCNDDDVSKIESGRSPPLSSSKKQRS